LAPIVERAFSFDSCIFYQQRPQFSRGGCAVNALHLLHDALVSAGLARFLVVRADTTSDVDAFTYVQQLISLSEKAIDAAEPRQTIGWH